MNLCAWLIKWDLIYPKVLPFFQLVNFVLKAKMGIHAFSTAKFLLDVAVLAPPVGCLDNQIDPFINIIQFIKVVFHLWLLGLALKLVHLKLVQAQVNKTEAIRW